MLRALQELGAYLIDVEGRGGLSDYLSLGKLKNEQHLLAIQFAQDDNGYAYDGVALYDLEGHEEEILYLKHWHNTHDETPTSKIHRVDSFEEKKNREGTVRNDAIDWIFEGWYDEAESNTPLITDIRSEYADCEEEIRRDVKDTWESVDNLEDCVLTVQYEQEGEMQFIADFDLFVATVKSKVTENWEEKYKETSRADGEHCVLCNERKTVFGFAFPFGFYTVDNQKYAPDFKQSKSWQNIPLCGDCALQLRVGYKFVEENNFSFYIGEPLQYYVVPSFPIEGPRDDALMASILDGSDDDDYSFMQAERFYEQKDIEYPLNLDILFYRMEQSSQKIERHVNDVSPPWMRKADQTLLRAHADIYRDYSLDTIDYQLDNLDTLKQLDTLIYRTIHQTDPEGNPEVLLNDALDLTERILTSDNIEYGRLVTLVGDEIHTRLRNNTNYRGYTLRAFLLLTFLARLGVLKDHEVTMKDYEDIKADWAETVPENVRQFFADFPEAFNTAAKRAVFLEGVLAQHLIDAQSQIRNSNDAPLRKKLSSLRLTVDRVQTLLPDLYQDIDAYDRKSDYPIEYRSLRTATARYFAEADDGGWDLADEEVRYYFVLGMSLNRVFKESSSDDQQDQDLMAEIGEE